MQMSPTMPSRRPFLSRLARHQWLLIGAAIVVLGAVAWHLFGPALLFVNTTINKGFAAAAAAAPGRLDPSPKAPASGMIHKVATGQGAKTMETATFAGGCFWCVQPPFEKLPGVSQVLAGYAGGSGDDPTYGNYAEKGYVEAVEMKYDPSQISYNDLLNVFWRQINPTDAGGQFVDRGPQYRSVIFYHSDEQKRLAEKSKADLAASGRFKPADRHGNHTGHYVHQGRGVPPGLSFEEPGPVLVLPLAVGPRPVPRQDLGDGPYGDDPAGAASCGRAGVPEVHQGGTQKETHAAPVQGHPRERDGAGLPQRVLG